MVVTALYGALLAFLFVYLTVQVVKLRRTRKIGLGDADDRALKRAIRVHANFAEYAPLCLILIGLAESMGPPSILVHVLGGALVVGRALHAYGFGREPDYFPGRVYGMYLTVAALVGSACVCLVYSVTGSVM